MKHLIKPIFICAFTISLFLGLKHFAEQDVTFERTPQAQAKWDQIEKDTEDIIDKAEISWLSVEAKKDLNHTVSMITDFLGFRKTGESSFSSGMDAIRGIDASGDKDYISETTPDISLSSQIQYTENVTETGLEEVELVYVVDGDTVMVTDSSGNEYRVRFIGIDTPESVNPDESKNTTYGKMASDHTKELLNDVSTLYLEYDSEVTDKYGRVLAYVWLKSDKSDISNMLNYKILCDGYATTMKIAPNTKYADVFESAKMTASASNTGLWADDGYKSIQG